VARTRELTGKQKAAILMVSLGAEASANIMKCLREDEIEELTLEIANLKRVGPDIKDNIMEEFLQICIAQEYIV
jgi:flagellar motor switch protein FliG